MILILYYYFIIYPILCAIDPRLFFIVPFLAMFHDLIRLFKKKSFYTWEKAYEKIFLYSYGDFFNECSKIKFINFLFFIIINQIVRFIFIIELVITADLVLIRIMFKNKNVDIKNTNSIVILLFLHIPWLFSAIINNRIKNKKFLSKEEFRIFVLNWKFVLIWGRSRWSINNTIFLYKTFKNFSNDPCKKDIKWLQKITVFVIKKAYIEKLQDR